MKRPLGLTPQVEETDSLYLRITALHVEGSRCHLLQDLNACLSYALRYIHHRLCAESVAEVSLIGCASQTPHKTPHKHRFLLLTTVQLQPHSLAPCGCSSGQAVLRHSECANLNPTPATPSSCFRKQGLAEGNR